jgi:hypothetical protein
VKKSWLVAVHSYHPVAPWPKLNSCVMSNEGCVSPKNPFATESDLKLVFSDSEAMHHMNFELLLFVPPYRL